MKSQLFILILCIAFSLQIAFRSILQNEVNLLSAPLASQPAVITQTSQVTNTLIATATSQPVQKPDIPRLVEELYMGVPVGNGYFPNQIAVDSEEHLAYSLNKGFEEEGNTLTVLDTETGELTALLKLNQNAGYPYDLLLDPYRPRLYALWGESFENRVVGYLTIIDTETLTISQTITDVMAVAPGPDHLYLGNETYLRIVDPDSLVELAGNNWEQKKTYKSLLFNPTTNRLYLHHATEQGLLEVYAADSLRFVGAYKVDNGELYDMIIDPISGKSIIALVDEGRQVFLRVLDADGRPSPEQKLTQVEEATYPYRLVLDKQALYLTVGGNRLRKFSLPELLPERTVVLPPYPTDLALDPTTSHLYATYAGNSQGDGHYILDIDLNSGVTRPFYTYLSIVDALVDPEAGRLYLLNEQGTVHILNLNDHTEIGRVETGYQSEAGHYVGIGRLSLDPKRNRLYIDGGQLRVIDTTLLTVTHRLDDLAGQITPDPTGDRLYFTEVTCGTLILNADTFTGTEIIFPAGLTEPPPPMSFCFDYTRLDAENQLLYGHSRPCSGGSSCGGNGFMSIYDVSGTPRFLGTTDTVVGFDSSHRRAFAHSISPYGEISISRLDLQADTIIETLQVFGTSFSDRLFYDAAHDRLYSNHTIFDGNLAILAPINLTGSLLAFDAQRQHLYFSHRGHLLIASTSGGQLELPPPANSADEAHRTSEFQIAPEGTHFRLDTFNVPGNTYSRLYRSTDAGETWKMLGRGLSGYFKINTLAIFPDFAQSQTLLAGMDQGGLYRSTDGGDTWSPSTRGLTSLRIKEITFSPSFIEDQTIFLTAVDEDDDDLFFQSTDNGETWIGFD